MQTHRKSTIFGIATGRRLDDALAMLQKYHIPQPDVLISSQGTEIHYAPDLTEDTVWERHIDHCGTRRRCATSSGKCRG